MTTDSAISARQRLLDGIDVTERTLDLSGISTPVVSGGDGPPMVLLHGPGGNATHWARVLPELVLTNGAVAADLPGHGASVVQGALDSERILGWLGELIEATCPEPPVLVGLAAGGALAARFAAAQGDRVASLVLVSSLGLVPFSPDPAFGAAMHEFLGAPGEETHERLWRKCVHDLDGLRRGMGEGWAPFEAYNLDRARTPSVMAALHVLMQDFGGGAPIPAAELEAIAVPTTLIWGRDDLATSVAVAEAASTRYGWFLQVIDECGADPQVEQPEAFVRALQGARSASHA